MRPPLKRLAPILARKKGISEMEKKQGVSDAKLLSFVLAGSIFRALLPKIPNLKGEFYEHAGKKISLYRRRVFAQSV
jgi:hypothetical protein